MQFTDFKIIQVGDVILKGANTTIFPRNKKTFVENRLYADGSRVTNKLDLREDLPVKFSCQFDDSNFDTYQYLLATLDEPLFQVYFVRYEKYNGNVLKSNILHGNLGQFVPTFYCGYARIENNLDNDYLKSSFKFREIETTIIVESIEQVGEYLKYLPRENEKNIKNTLWGGGAVWSPSGITWGQYYDSFIPISRLTNNQLSDLLICNNCGCPELQVYLNWFDPFIYPSFKSLQSYQILEKSTGALDSYTRILLSSTNLSVNILTSHPIWGIRPQKTVVTEITRINSVDTILINAMQKDDTFIIKNNNNGSGWKLIWRSNTGSPQIIQIRFQDYTLWNVGGTSGFVQIDTNLYSLEALGENNEGLYFSSKAIKNPIYDISTGQNLQSEFISGTFPLGTNRISTKVTNYNSTY